MNFLGIARSVINPMTVLQVATGPVGWASLAARAVLSQAASAAIQHFGSQMGLPHSAINMMQTAASNSFGNAGGVSWRDAIRNFNQFTNASPFNSARNERIAQDSYEKIFESVGKIMKQSRDEANGSGKTSGKNWIRALVEALGKRLDNLAGEMERLGQQVDSGAKKSGELQAVSAEFGLISAALNTVMKSVAEGQVKLASKNG